MSVILVHELCDAIQRFPQDARVLLCDGQILVSTPDNYGGESAFDVFDAQAMIDTMRFCAAAKRHGLT